MKYLPILTTSITLLLSGCFGDTPETNETSASSAGTVNSEAKPVSSVTIPETEEEKMYIRDYSCLEPECYGYKKFYKFITTKYPDIKNIKFNPSDDISSDPDANAMYKEMFYVGLYYTKQIQLANGQSLFDFLTKCSKKVDALNGGQMGVDKNGNRFISMQYFPVLKQIGTGEEVELDMMFERHGNTITSSSPWLSTHALENKNFMQQHGVQCWN